MKFTKENVEKVIDDYFRQAGFEPCGDLIAEIRNLDDTPEKVGVPKCFDEWFKEIYERGPIKNARKQFALWKICQFGFGSYLQNVNGEDIKDCELSTWVGNNRMIAIDAVLNGYEVEKQLYAVRGLTDYFRLDNKVILFDDKQKALDIANKIGECCEIEVLDRSSDLNFILISEIRNGL